MQAEGHKLVLTNGCFDLLHAGHVRYLHQARQRGDALAVALNDDESVRRLKGSSRPINPVDDRAEVLAALQDVDFVTIFGEDDARDVVREIRPAVYVKGGDYDPDPASAGFPPEGEIVIAYGGAVEILSYVPGRSTTGLVERLREETR